MNEEFSSSTLALAGNRLGHTVSILPRTGSTNDDAMERAGKHGVEGEVILAEVQDTGRGRLDRSWESPAGRNLLFSVILKPGIKPERAFLVTLLSAVAGARAIQKVTGIKCDIKWPNDLLIEGRKVCGILCEARVNEGVVDPLILGIGVNVNSRMEEIAPELRDSAISLYSALGREVSRVELFRELMRELDHWYGKLLEGNDQAVREAWLAGSAMVGNTVSVNLARESYSGEVLGIGKDGSLLVLSDGKERRVVAGDVTRVRTGER